MRWRRFTWIALVAWPLLAHGQASAPPDRRMQIAAQREGVEARHRQALLACEREFTQTACIDQARRARRRDIGRLDAELATLDLAERQRRAAARQRRLDEKQQAEARREAQAAPPAASAARPSRAGSAAVTPTRARKADAEQAAAAADAASARQAARSRRLAEQKAHAEAARQRNAERARRRAPAAPLPVEPASALR